MTGVNKAIILGTVGSDVKTEYSKDGKAFAKLSVATSEKYKNAENTVWHDVVCFGERAEYCHVNVRKGDTVYVEGKISKRRYTDKSGVEKTSFNIAAFTLQHFPKYTREQTDEEAATEIYNANQNKKVDLAAGFKEMLSEDDIAF